MSNGDSPSRKIYWPESACVICGRPTTDEGGCCSNACVDAYENMTAPPEEK